MDSRAAASPRAAVQTNVFELCALKTLTWQVFAPRSDTGVDGDRAHATEPSRDALDAFAVFAGAVKQQANALYAWQPQGDEAPDRLWTFSVNHTQKMPTPNASATVDVVDSGDWTAMSIAVLPDDAQRLLFRALHVWLAQKLLGGGVFRLQSELFTLNEARFVYRSPSLSRANHFDVYLDESHATTGFQLHFQLLQPSQTLCVSVQVLHHTAAEMPLQPELGSISDSWLQMLGLPRSDDHSMIDVWHADDSLAARAVAETKYEGIYPSFRALPRRRVKRKGENGGDGPTGDEDDSMGKNGKNDDADDGDDDQDGGGDGDADGDDASRRNGMLGNRKRRRKVNNDVLENDESVAPVSPDTHVNSPDAGGPVVQMTFPRDDEVLLHTDSDIHIFKRRRRKKNPADQPSGMISFGPLLTPVLSATATRTSIPMLGRVRSGSMQRPETPKPPTLSLAVSLVASLTHDEQQEVMESKPVKPHPLLQALDDYVEKEMDGCVMNDKPSSDVGLPSTRLVPHAPGFSPSIDEKKTRKVAHPETSVSYEHLRSQLMSDRFKRWLTGYYPRDFRRNKRQQRREHERKLLLEYDEAKLQQYTGSAQVSSSDASSVRGKEITIGIQLAALDVLVPWRLHGRASSRWTRHSSHCRGADEKDMQALVSHVTPFLTQLQGVVKGKGSDLAADDEAGEVRDPWMTLDDYISRTSPAKEDSDAIMHGTPLDKPPRLCVSTLESALEIDVPAISEYGLRNFQPVAAAKPVDYAVVCPATPGQWLGTLTLAYLTMLRSVYAPTSMGDQVAMDLSGMRGDKSVKVDVASAMMLIDCTTSSEDAFGTYRAAGELLRPLLAQGTKQKQAFSRSAVANVVFLVAPFRRSDIKHKMWLLGAFGRGLFGTANAEVKPDWAGSVVVELLYVEDLVDVSLGANPNALLPAGVALYDRVFEQVSLKPIIANGESVPKSRYVSERLYHLANPSNDESTAPSAFVHAGYSLSTDGKWLVVGFTDAVGAMLETKAIPLPPGDSEGITTALLSFAEAAFEFVALIGEKSVLAITQLGASTSSSEVWQALATRDAFVDLTRRYECVVSKIVVCQASFLSAENVQVRPSSTSSVALCLGREAVLVARPHEASHFQERSRIANTKWLRSTQRPTQETALLRVQLLHSMVVGESTGAAEDSETMLSALLTNWSSLSYLTTHPVSLQRQSPLPLHLTAVDELVSELEMLATQLATDPLTLRR